MVPDPEGRLFFWKKKYKQKFMATLLPIRIDSRDCIKFIHVHIYYKFLTRNYLSLLMQQIATIAMTAMTTMTTMTTAMISPVPNPPRPVGVWGGGRKGYIESLREKKLCIKWSYILYYIMYLVGV